MCVQLQPVPDNSFESTQMSTVLGVTSLSSAHPHDTFNGPPTIYIYLHCHNAIRQK